MIVYLVNSFCADPAEGHSLPKKGPELSLCCSQLIFVLKNRKDSSANSRNLSLFLPTFGGFEDEFGDFREDNLGNAELFAEQAQYTKCILGLF